MIAVEQATSTEHVRLTGAVKGSYVIQKRGPNGQLLIAPDTSWPAILERSGARELTAQEWEQFIAEYGDLMLPPDHEG